MNTCLKCIPSSPKVGPTSSSQAQFVVQALYASAIGVDVHANLLVCTYQSSSGTDPQTHQPLLTTQMAEFGANRSELDKFALWCKAHAPEVILMESTGVLWQSPYEALESIGFTSRELKLVNARDVKAILGKKTDKQDALRLAEIARMGSVKASFVPPKDFREMRTIARRYQSMSKEIATATNILHKLMNSIGFRASSVFSDVQGKAARKILEAKICNVTDFSAVVENNCTRLRASHEKILDALNFDISETMREQVRSELEHLTYLKSRAEATMQRLRSLQQPYQKPIELLMSIPGIRETSARLIFAELCPDLKSQFQKSERFCSWLGICPGNNISANKRYSGHASKGNRWLRRIITECANAISFSKLNLRDRFEAFKLRRGRLRAIVAIGHLLCRIIYSVLTTNTEYRNDDRVGDRVAQVLKERVKKNVKQLAQKTRLSRNGNCMIEKDTGEIICQLPVCG